MQSSSQKPPIFGIDILPQSSPQGTLAFSLVIIRGSQILERYERVSLGRLIRLSRSLKPRFIAMDNVYELASSSTQLLKIISLLPSETQIVQATGSPKEGLRQLHLIATEHGLSLPSKASPLQTAEVAARLVSMGVGHYIEAFKKRTSIAVTKGRVFGPGGMSQQRYRRRLCLAVLQVSHKIREGLKAEGLDYDLTVRRSRWGYESCHFIVFAERTRLYGIAKPIRGPDVRVVVEPIAASEVEFKPLGEIVSAPLTGKVRPTIVGIDPGIVTGIAVVSLDGEVLSLFSGRGLDRARIIESLTSIGHPVLVCSDVIPAPDTVRKVAAALDSKVFYPETPLSTVDKREIAQHFLEESESTVRAEDTHQRDALAAAVKAYLSLKNKFEEADARITETGLRVSRDLVRSELVRGATIAEALEIATPIPPPTVRRFEEPKEEAQLLNLRIRSLEERLRSQREIIEKLSEARDKMQEEQSLASTKILELESQLEREKSASEAQLRQSREVQSLQGRIRNLEADFQQLNIENEASKYKYSRLSELIKKTMRNEIVLVKTIPSLTRQSVEQATINLSIARGEIVYVAEANTASLQGAQALASRGVAAVIVHGQPPQVVLDFIEGHGIPTLRMEAAEIEECEGFQFVNKNRLDDLLRSSRERIEVKEREASRETLSDVLEEYRRHRSKHA